MMPGWLFHAYARMYPRLVAEERLLGIGNGRLAAQPTSQQHLTQQQQQIQAIQRDAYPPDERDPETNRTRPEALLAFLGGAGITPQRVRGA